MQSVRLLYRVKLNIQLNPLAEHFTAIKSAAKGKLNLSMSIALDSSLVN
jgi:Ca2+/H+ antiporter